MSIKPSDRRCHALQLADCTNGMSIAELRTNQLKELASRLHQPSDFARGQFVRWKPGLKNRASPDYDEPAIVTDVLPTPVFDLTEASAGSPYFHEPLTLVIGVFREDDLLEFRVDRRRFEPLPGSTAKGRQRKRVERPKAN